MRVARGVVAVLTAAVAMVAVTGCGTATTSGGVTQASPTSNGVAELSADEILARAKSAALAETSVYFLGKGGSSSDSVALDLKVAKGSGATGSISVGSDTLQLVTTPSDLYIKGDKAFWAKRGNEKAAELIGTRWVKIPADNPDWSSIGFFGDFDKMLQDLLSPSSAITKGRQGDVDGQPAIALDSSKGSLWVATTGKPLPLKVDDGKGAGIAMKDWGAPVTITPPPDSEVIDLSKLQS